MKTVTILLLLLTFVACQSDKKPGAKVINKRILSGDFEMYEHLSISHCDSLSRDSLNTYYKDDSLYSGVCFLYHPDTEKKSEIRQIFKGKLHGNRIDLSLKGDTLTQSIYNLGKLISRTTRDFEICHCDSLQEIVIPEGVKLMYYRKTPFNGICQRFFPEPDTNRVYLEMPFKNGLVHGDMVIYNRLGDEILTEVYENGKKVKL